ncbi:MAG: hypothetical protein ABI417_08950 [Coleofasciculaceae cyanobacterium]
MITLDTANANNWSQVWQQNGIPVSIERYSQITCPILLSSPVIALMFSVPLSLEAWKFGGYINREIATNLTVGGQSDARLESSRRLYVNRLQVITYSVKTTYSLIINAAIQGSNCSLSAWEYTGLIT